MNKEIMAHANRDTFADYIELLSICQYKIKPFDNGKHLVAGRTLGPDFFEEGPKDKKIYESIIFENNKFVNNNVGLQTILNPTIKRLNDYYMNPNKAMADELKEVKTIKEAITLLTPFFARDARVQQEINECRKHNAETLHTIKQRNFVQGILASEKGDSPTLTRKMG